MRHPRPHDSLLQKHPALAKAFRQASARFNGNPGVYGVGIGRKIHQSTGHYPPVSTEHGGLCVTILVHRKYPPRSVPAADLIPSEITLLHGGQQVSIATDVIESPLPRLQLASDGRIPTAGELNVGRLFSFGLFPCYGPSGTYGDNEAVVGTTGALFSRGEATIAVTAGHVIIDTCSGQLVLPRDDRSIGVLGRDWVRLVNSGSFLPLQLGTSAGFTDAAVFAPPPALVPVSASWPAGFSRDSFATEDDQQAAIHAPGGKGFVWCERPGEFPPLKGLPIDLVAGIDPFSAPSCISNWLYYDWVWQYRLLGDPTIGGDSGAGVFIRCADNPARCRLLGFHFLYDAEKNLGYCVDAELMLRVALNQDINNGYTFA